MPNYQLRCTKCEASLEFFGKFSDAEVFRCTECGGASQIEIQPVPVHWGDTPGFIRRAEVSYENEDGKRITKRLSHLENKQVNPNAGHDKNVRLKNDR